jgi:hypothetical protein
MFVRDVEVVDSPIAAGRTRLRGEVVCDDPSIPPEVYWFDIPATHARALGASGNPWLVLLAPLAVHLGEPLRIPRPVDRDLLANVHDLMRVWQCWFPNLRPVSIDVDEVGATPEQDVGLTASMFSGGVDAWFTLLSNNGSARLPGGRQIDELLCVWGLDISLEHPEEFRRMRDTLARSTSGLGAELVEVATNLHETQWWRRADWGYVAHGCGLASIALTFGSRYSRVLIPSSHRYDDQSPWGSHPLTDPLLSTRRTRIIHDGSGYSRVEKTAAIAESDAALQSLQVCWETKTFSNCGACVKCYRTMATLHLLGALDRCPRFPRGAFDPTRLSRVFSERESERALMREVQDLALQKHQPDVARAIERSFPVSRRAAAALRYTRFLATVPLLWRLRDPLEHALRSQLIM